MGAGICVLLASVFFYAISVPCHSEPTIVTLSSPNLETMNTLITVIDMDALTTRDQYEKIGCFFLMLIDLMQEKHHVLGP